MSAQLDRIVIVGAGASTLVSALVSEGHGSIVAVDISAAALDQLRAQLGDQAGRVETVVCDVRDLVLDRPVALWHDRATFHFLIGEDDQVRYVRRAARAVRQGGSLILAAFATDGPEQCSGLPVRRWSADDLAERFAPWFALVGHDKRTHTTPWGAAQSFTHVLMTRMEHNADG